MNIENIGIAFDYIHQFDDMKQHSNGINHCYYIITKPTLCMAIAMNERNVKIIEMKIFPNNVNNQCQKNQHYIKDQNAPFSKINQNIAKYVWWQILDSNNVNMIFDALAMVNVMAVINPFIHHIYWNTLQHKDDSI